MLGAHEGRGQKDLHKLGDGAEGDTPWVYGHVWAAEEVEGTCRLKITPREDHVRLMTELLQAMPEPLWLLYVLVVPRGEGEAGRYQSPAPLDRREVLAFLEEFRTFLEADARQSLWIRSESGAAMLVYDRHNLIYAYGPLPEFAAVLARREMREVESGAIRVPDPHSHHYHQEFDTAAQQVLGRFAWQRTPLRAQDEA